MKIAVTADLHLTTYGDHPERYNALENILQQLKEQGIDTLVIAGDLFDKNFHNYSEFEGLCRQYPHVRMHIIPGNHDAAISGEHIVAPNIRIYTEPAAETFDSTTFLFIPYKEKVRMSEQIAASENDINGKNWVLIGHGDYYGGLKEVNPLEPGTFMPLSRENISTFRPHIVLLGHIHKPFQSENVYYAGSPCGLDLGETGKRRFLVYDTVEKKVTPCEIVPDVLYFDESFIIVPAENEIILLRQEIEKRIELWGLGQSDYAKVIVRVRASGYAMNRKDVLTVLKEYFDRFNYYHDDAPSIEELEVGTDYQLNAIAERTMQLIDEMEWDFGGGEPEKEQVKTEALKAIYRTRP